MFIYYAIQLPCNPKFDFNYAFYSEEEVLEAMNQNYGKTFKIVEKNGGRYVQAIETEEDYARIVEIYLKEKH